MDIKKIAGNIQNRLGLKSQPVALSFVEKAPDGVQKIAASEAAGCGYWRKAAEGETFYTDAADHHGCPIGSHTHNVPMPIEKKTELEGMIGQMVELGYVKMEEIPMIPKRADAFKFAVYGPLADAAQLPDVILMRGTVRQLMILSEAASAAGIAGESPTMGRPTCAVIPQVLNSGKTSASFGCIGNRVYTQAPDDEAYYAVAGAQLEKMAGALETIAKANEELEKFHRSRLASV